MASHHKNILKNHLHSSTKKYLKKDGKNRPNIDKNPIKCYDDSALNLTNHLKTMPNKQNAKKALRQSIKRAALNRARKDAFKKATKATLKAASAAEAKKLASAAQAALDKAAKAGTIKKNTAARRLSRLMKKVNKLAK